MCNIAVSVVIPVYNAQKHLHNCLDSLLSQKLEAIEFILVNDGSTDASGEICDKYAEKDNRVKVVHIKNGGPARARNLGMASARGEYIGFVDSDDYIAPDMFEKLYNTAKQYDSDIAMCSYNIVSKNNINPVKLSYKPLYDSHELIENELLQAYYCGKVNGLYSLWNKIYKNDIIRSNGIVIDEKLRRGEDAWFNFDILKFTRKLVFIDDCLYFYVQNNGSIMHTIQPDQYSLWVSNRKRLLEENKTFGFKIDYNHFYSDFLYKVAVYCRKMIKNKNTETVIKILSDDFYCEAAKYTECLPIHIKLLHKIGKSRWKRIAVFFYRLW